jgi:hypothetical protein
MPAHENNFFNGKTKAGVELLGDEGKLLSQFAFRITAEFLSFVKDIAGPLAFDSGKKIEKGCFTAAIWADNPIKFTGLKGEIDILQNRYGAIGKGNFFKGIKRSGGIIATHSFCLFVSA